jgi:hypothetical protein
VTLAAIVGGSLQAPVSFLVAENRIMNTTLRYGAFVGLLVLSVSCGGAGSTTPTPVTAPQAGTASPTLPPPTNLPPLSGLSRTFVFRSERSYPVRDYTRNSRFILYDTGAFVLQYVSLGDYRGEYRGSYANADGVIVFSFGGGNAAGSWNATGTLTGDLLTVQYNQIMLLDDFEDAVYVSNGTTVAP